MRPLPAALAAVASTAILWGASPATAQQFFEDFNDWDEPCDANSCLLRVANNQGAMAGLSAEPQCFEGGETCFEAFYPDGGSVRLNVNEMRMPPSHTLYVESMFHYEPEPMAFARLLVAHDEAGGYEVKVGLTDDFGLKIESFDLSSGGPIFVYSNTIPAPTLLPARWGRVGVLLDHSPRASSVDVTVWLGDDDTPVDAFELPVHDRQPFPEEQGFSQVWLLGEPVGEAVPFTLRVDDVCMSVDANARQAYCEPRRTPEPSMPDAGGDGASSGVNFRGSGGCACDVVPGASVRERPSWLLAALLPSFLLLHLLSHRTRRRAQRP